MNPRKPWWSVHRVDEQDMGRQLRLIGPGAWTIFALYGAVIIALTYVFERPNRSAATDVVAIAILLAAALLIVSPSPTRIPIWRVVGVLSLALTAVALLTVREPIQSNLPDQAAWYQAAANFLFFGLALRGRVAAAWIGETLMIAFVCAWSTAATGSPLYGIAMSYGQPISLVAGTIFAIALHTTARRIVEFRTAQRHRAALEAGEAAENAAAESERRKVRELAEPTLRLIAAGRNPDKEDARTLEAALRDLIRGRSLAIEPLNTALREARRRGVDVVVLDDSSGASATDQVLARAAAWCATILETIHSGTSTIRLADTPRGGLVTIVSDPETRHERLLTANN